METLLRASEVAKILNVRPSTIYALAHRGVLHFVRIAQGARRSLIRFRPSDIEHIVRDQTEPSIIQRT